MNLKIADRAIGDGRPVFVIAEAGANHNGDLATAKEMAVRAQKLGADCIKFQTFCAEEFCADRRKIFTYRSQGREVTESEYEMFKRLEFRRDEWADLMEFCWDRDILFMTTVQDPVNLEMMRELGLAAIKVGSDDFNHLANLRVYAATGLPLILSKGMSDAAETDRVLAEIAPLASGGLAALHCVSLYPCEARALNLNQIATLRRRYPDIVWGFSDHSRSTVAPALAVSLGARVIEKHFTLDHDMVGPDHWFSMDPAEMAEMIGNVRFAEQALGDGRIALSTEEAKSRAIMRRRVVARTALPRGTVLDENSVTFKRCDDGAFISEWDALKGCRLRVDKAANQGIAAEETEA